MGDVVIDEDVVRAVAWCRVGGVENRPVRESAFGDAKALGLLAQDPCWRATERGEGVLVAAGKLPGVPAPERLTVAVHWAVCERFPSPQLVATWTEWAWENIDPTEIEEAEARFRDFDCEQDWRFFTTIEHIDRPPVPAGREA